MGDGPIEVKGSVGIDRTDQLAKLYQLARRAREDNNRENAAKYYDMILLDDPTSWEASFFSVYFKAMSCVIARIESAANSIANCQDSVMRLIKKHVAEDEQLGAVKIVAAYSGVAAKTFFDGSIKHYNDIDSSIRWKFIDELNGRLKAAVGIDYACGDAIEKEFRQSKSIIKEAVESWLKGNELNSIYIARTEEDGFTKEKRVEAKIKANPYYRKCLQYDDSLAIDAKKEELDKAKKDLEEDKEDHGPGYYVAMGIGGIAGAAFGVFTFRDALLLDSFFLLILALGLIACGALMALGFFWAGSRKKGAVAERLSKRNEQITQLEKELQELEAKKESEEGESQ